MEKKQIFTNENIFTVIKEWVNLAINTHFSDVLEIENYNSDTIIIIMKNFNTNVSIMINYFPNSDPSKRDASVQTPYSAERFMNYNQLKKAIRNALLTIRMSELVINETDIYNDYKMNNNISDIINETKTPKNNSLIRFVKKAVYKHFSDVLYINSIKRKTNTDSFISILYKENIGFNRYLKIYYKGFVKYSNSTFKFSNYSELKKAIRNALLKIRIIDDINELNVNVKNNYKMLENKLNVKNNNECPNDRSIIRYVEKIVHKHFINVLDIQTFKETSDFYGKYIKIKLKYSNNAFIKIYYFNKIVDYSYGKPLVSNINTKDSTLTYSTYGQLKIAIRNAILKYSTFINATLTSNVDNKMEIIVNDHTPTPKNRELIQFIEKALKEVDTNKFFDHSSLRIRLDKNTDYMCIYLTKDKTRVYFYYYNLSKSYIFYDDIQFFFKNYGELKKAILQCINIANPCPCFWTPFY